MLTINKHHWPMGFAHTFGLEVKKSSVENNDKAN